MGQQKCKSCFGRGKESCSLCQGSGRAAGGYEGLCPLCGSSGSQQCSRCSGSGYEFARDPEPAHDAAIRAGKNPGKFTTLLCFCLIVAAGLSVALFGVSATYASMGQLAAPIVNWGSDTLSAYMTLDIAKAATVAGLYLSVAFLNKGFFKAGIHWFVRITFTTSLLALITAGVSFSDDDITPNSVWFGGIAELIENYR